MPPKKEDIVSTRRENAVSAAANKPDPLAPDPKGKQPQDPELPAAGDVGPFTLAQLQVMASAELRKGVRAIAAPALRAYTRRGCVGCFLSSP